MSVARGQTAEEHAGLYLQEHGFEIIAHNWRTRWCEIDIIARRHDIIHIVEVKYRARTNYGTAAEFVTYGKQERLIRAAASWVQQHRYNGPYQIDVVTVEGALDAPAITHLENAVTG